MSSLRRLTSAIARVSSLKLSISSGIRSYRRRLGWRRDPGGNRDPDACSSVSVCTISFNRNRPHSHPVAPFFLSLKGVDHHVQLKSFRRIDPTHSQWMLYIYRLYFCVSSVPESLKTIYIWRHQDKAREASACQATAALDRFSQRFFLSKIIHSNPVENVDMHPLVWLYTLMWFSLSNNKL